MSLLLPVLFAQALWDLAVKGGSTHGAGCILSLGDRSSYPATSVAVLQVQHWDLFSVVKHLPGGI